MEKSDKMGGYGIELSERRVDEFSYQKHQELADFEGLKDGQYRNVGE